MGCLPLFMLLTSIFNILLTLAFLMITAPSPLILGALILIFALTASLALTFFSSSWFALLLFLIYIGGLLVMFSYFVALSPNKTTFINLTHLFILFPTLQLISTLCPTQATFHTINPIISPTILSLLINKNIPLFIFLATILFLTLLMVVKIISRSAGPLRPFSSPTTLS